MVSANFLFKINLTKSACTEHQVRFSRQKFLNNSDLLVTVFHNISTSFFKHQIFCFMILLISLKMSRGFKILIHNNFI